MKITGSIMPSNSVNETSKITSDSSSLKVEMNSGGYLPSRKAAR